MFVSIWPVICTLLSWVYSFFISFNFLSPKSIQHELCSPSSINAWLREKVTRINEMITKWNMLWSFDQILPTNSLRKCMVTSLENLCMDIRARRVKAILSRSSQILNRSHFWNCGVSSYFISKVTKKYTFKLAAVYRTWMYGSCTSLS